jgi:hypothetical protein
LHFKYSAKNTSSGYMTAEVAREVLRRTLQEKAELISRLLEAVFDGLRLSGLWPL